ncbi:lngG [Salmonella enterica subsp. enterica]|nr:lngG [Salmonella enterica]EEI1253435.1 lngG [Salmonella enterica subsp. enterica]EEL2516793.1 lngG [Salmonella enterica]EEO4172577.1 lngG [Salmonella enterica subsp. enterica]EIO8741081.1 lngG [Salmonella enterica]
MARSDMASVAAPVTTGQDQIVRALQDDIVFERQKRQLSNELALEKLRAELQKVRGEGGPAVTTMPVAPPPVAMPVRDEPTVPVMQAAPPTVVLVSQVAGVSRVGVSVNGQLRFVGRNETFPANGKKYRLVPAKNSLLAVREVK